MAKTELRKYLDPKVVVSTSPRRGRKNCSPGRKPWDMETPPHESSPVGAKEILSPLRGLGLFGRLLTQGLRLGLQMFRPSGAGEVLVKLLALLLAAIPMCSIVGCRNAEKSTTATSGKASKSSTQPDEKNSPDTFVFNDLDEIVLTSSEISDLGLKGIVLESEKRDWQFGSWVRSIPNRRIITFQKDKTADRFAVAICLFSSFKEANAGMMQYISWCNAAFPLSYHKVTGDKMWGMGLVVVKDNLVIVVRGPDVGKKSPKAAERTGEIFQSLLTLQLQKIDRLAGRSEKDIAKRIEIAKDYITARYITKGSSKIQYSSGIDTVQRLRDFLKRRSPSTWDADAHLAIARGLGNAGQKDESVREYELLKEQFPKFAKNVRVDEALESIRKVNK